MANEQNLKPITSESMARELGRKGGLAKAKSMAKKRTMREIAEMVATMELKDPKMLAALHAAGFQDPITNDDAAFFALGGVYNKTRLHALVRGRDNLLTRGLI